MSIWPILKEELILYRNTSNSINDLLATYENECFSLMHHMKQSSFPEAQSDFDRLYDIKNKLSTIHYHYGFKLNERLQNLIQYLSQDDIHLRQTLYREICNGMYWPGVSRTDNIEGLNQKGSGCQ